MHKVTPNFICRISKQRSYISAVSELENALEEERNRTKFAEEKVLSLRNSLEKEELERAKAEDTVRTIERDRFDPTVLNNEHRYLSLRKEVRFALL